MTIFLAILSIYLVFCYCFLAYIIMKPGDGTNEFFEIINDIGGMANIIFGFSPTISVALGVCLILFTWPIITALALVDYVKEKLHV